MILVILPLGKEAPQVANWVLRVVMYTAASTVGGAIFALAMGGIGQGINALFPALGFEWALALLGLASVAYALHELNIIRLPNPQRGWLVPKSWQRSSRLVGNMLYGIVLGMGVFTFVPFASFYILIALEIVVGAVSLQAAVLLGMLYGLFRGFPAVLGGISMLRGVYPMPVSNWLIERLGWWHAINGLVLLLFGGFLLGSFIL